MKATLANSTQLRQLTSEQKGRLQNFFQPFRVFLRESTAQGWQQDREARTGLYRQILTVEKILELTEGEFEQLIGSLWANGWWKKKEYVVKRILESTTFTEVKRHLRDLLWSKEPLRLRYDAFRQHVKGLGPAALTELLAFVHPDECGLWNDKSRQALKAIGFDPILGDITSKYQISGADYERVNSALGLIRDEMKAVDFHDANLLDVDFLLYYILTEHPQAQVEVEQPARKDEEFDHDELIEKLVTIGTGLGFTAESEYAVAPGARVDVIWSASIANLGVVKYVFEVQKSGSIDSLLLNLQRAQNNPSVQKLVVVGSEDTLTKVRREASALREDFRKSLAYMDAQDVLKAAKLQEELGHILNRLELIKADFPLAEKLR